MAGLVEMVDNTSVLLRGSALACNGSLKYFFSWSKGLGRIDLWTESGQGPDVQEVLLMFSVDIL